MQEKRQSARLKRSFDVHSGIMRGIKAAVPIHMLDLNDISRLGEFEFETTSLGPLYFETVTTGHYLEMVKMVEADGATGEMVAREVMALLGHRPRPEPAEGDKESSEHGPKLTEQDVSEVSSDEVERFAQVFLEQNKWLNKSVDLGEIQKDPEETYCAFLIRVVQHYRDSQRAQWERMTKPFSSGILGSATAAAWRASNAASETLGKTIADLRAARPTSIPDPEPLRIPQFRSPMEDTNKKLDRVIGHLEGMRPIATGVAEVIYTLNHTALAMQASYVSNAKDTGRQSIIALSVAVAGLLASSIFAYLTLVDARESGAENRKHVETLQAEIRALKEAQKEDRAALLNALSKAQARPDSQKKTDRQTGGR